MVDIATKHSTKSKIKMHTGMATNNVLYIKQQLMSTNANKWKIRYHILHAQY